MSEEENTRKLIEECHEEIRRLKRDLYGNPQIRQPGLFARLDQLEERHANLLRRYDREVVEKDNFVKIEDELVQLKLDTKVLMVLLKAAVGGVGTILVTLIGAIAVGILRFGGPPAGLLGWWLW